ncbi:putative membrane protein YcfT [Kineococcus radiotolerans]|uniref:Putative membrane protein YcfT n=1 Tax=Kineococcus radiotolerans TaxID=131568 RepID=A0A7W4TNU2_KINRA|nr:acyltransferase [Kineococcus radiotolerans]MBB2901978.1 putative membrane protein YcfT [Kineococcus radiotolerans]
MPTRPAETAPEAPPRAARPRQTWMDVVRGVAVLLVVVFHAGTLLRYADLPVPAVAGTLVEAVAPFRIPLLALLSGALLPQSAGKGAGRYVSGKLRGIVWPFLLWTAVYALLTWPGGLDPVGWYLPTLLHGGSYLWYLLFLAVFYLLALPLRRVPKLPVVGLVLLLSEVLPDDTKYLERPAYLFALFVLGWWVAERPARLVRLVSSRWVFLAALVALVPATLWAPESGYGPRSFPATVAGALVVAGVAARCADAALLRPLRFAGRNSIVFYVVHFPVIYVLVHVAARWDGIPASALLAAGVVAAVAAATVLASLRSRWRPVEWLFTAPGAPGPARRGPAPGPA